MLSRTQGECPPIHLTMKLTTYFYRLQFGYKPEQHTGLHPHTPGGPGDDPDMVRVYDGAPGSAPTLIKKEDLVNFTSSKSTKEEGLNVSTKLEKLLQK